MTVHIGDPNPVICTPMAHLLPRDLDGSSSTVQLKSPPNVLLRSGKLMLSSRRFAIKSFFPFRQLRICNADFGLPSFLTRLSIVRKGCFAPQSKQLRGCDCYVPGKDWCFFDPGAGSPLVPWTFNFGVNVAGEPWRLVYSGPGSPFSILQSGTVGPTGDATITGGPTDGCHLDPAGGGFESIGIAYTMQVACEGIFPPTLVPGEDNWTDGGYPP